MRRGFTLLELLAVMAILTILMAATAYGVGKYIRIAEEREVEAQLQQLSALASGQYEMAKGDVPPDNFTGLACRPPNDKNDGIESMVAALAAPNASWPLPDEKHLANTDDDKFPKKTTGYPTLDAYEMADRWGNPIVYIHCKSYGKKFKVLAKRAGTKEFDEQTVEAMRNPKTDLYYCSESFQLISAGRDGVFGTDDDLMNFRR